MTCPDDDIIADLLADRLGDEARHALVGHLDSCSDCRRLVADAAGDDEAGDELRLQPGSQVGRYVVGRIVGAGALGVVHAAADPQLGREVAVKVLRRGRVAGREHLLREAQTLARLSHPNLVTVHDVGELGGHLFIAMELVDGETLRQWLEARPRRWDEIRDVFLQAGRGLAAAHAAGVVHRDFKPDNVLVGRDGRVRVGDFGLAGTPAYMPPEQRAGGEVDARADLYSFCVALAEAVDGRRPRPDEPLPRGGLPARVRRVVERGLAAAPARRPAGMADLLAELAPRPARRWPLLVAAALSLAAAAAVVAWPRAECTGAAAAWGALWNDAQRQTVAAAFGPARVAFASVDAALGDVRRRWIATHTAVCRAGRSGDQSAALVDRRMTCLEARRKDAAAMIDLFAGGDRKLRDRAAEIVGRMERVEGCLAGRLSEVAPPPAGAREELDALAARVAQIKAQLEAGRGICLAIAVPAVEEARRAGYAPILAQLLYYRARCESDDERITADLHEAAAVAATGRDDDTLARAWIRLMYHRGFRLGEFAEARQWQRYARAVIDRMGGSDELELSWLQYAALNLGRQGKLDEQRAIMELARQRVLAREGPAAPVLAGLETQIGNSFTDSWRFADALPHHRAALALQEKVSGPESPVLITALLNLSFDLRGVGRAQEALDLFPRILAMSAASIADDSFVLSTYGGALRDAGRPAEALAQHRQAETTCARFAAGNARRCALHIEQEGQDLLALGRMDEAAAALEQARQLYGEHPMPDTAWFVALAIAARDPARARELAVEAWENVHALVTRRHGDRKRLDEIEAWLAVRGIVPRPDD